MLLPKKQKTPIELAMLRNVLDRLALVPRDLVVGRGAGLASRLGAIVRDLSIAIDNSEVTK